MRCAVGEMAVQTEMHPDAYTYPIQDAAKAEVHARYVPQGEQDGQLPLSPGEIVWVLEESSDGWCGGHKEGDLQTGWFPASAIHKIPRGDCMDDEEDDRKNSALYTSDHRAVASPQAKHRKVSAQAELAETKQRLAAVEAERFRLDDQFKALQKAHSESENDRQRLMKQCEEWKNKAQSLQDECKRKEDELRVQKDYQRQAEEQYRTEKKRTMSLEEKLKQLEDHRQKLEANLKSRSDARDDSGISKTTSGISRCDGHRTPSVPHTVSGVLSGSLQAPPAPAAIAAASASMTTIAQVSPSPLSARQPPSGLGSRHASPRHGATSYMPPVLTSSGGLPASPQLRQRVPSQRDLTVDSISHAPAVANLVSQFEKRSTSHGAPTTRETATNFLYRTTASSPSCTVRHAAHATHATHPHAAHAAHAIQTVPVVSGHMALTSSTVRAGSRDAPIHVARTHTRVVTPSSSRTAFQVEDPETPGSSHVTHIEDLSPFKRQPCTITRGTGQMQHSPPPRTNSVQVW
ncbi:unnamed protein product [Cladocopium goreaui]|uniref:SH3 domain-containing protein n=1 Tax=Cladocopium goreaui TaxID=2562237 RepID=A0A9P1GCV7_9DINO|nr:unnamed protein product [Cladocopium goreaui]